MPTMKLTGAEFVKRWKGIAAGRANAAVFRGMVAGAQRAVSILQTATTQARAIDTGAYRQAWRATISGQNVSVSNGRPYAGVIEYGRRPESRRPPSDVIARWAQRKLGLTRVEAQRAAFPIARAIARRGIRGKFIARSSAEQVMKVTREAIQTAMDAELAR